MRPASTSLFPLAAFIPTFYLLLGFLRRANALVCFETPSNPEPKSFCCSITPGCTEGLVLRQSYRKVGTGAKTVFVKLDLKHQKFNACCRNVVKRRLQLTGVSSTLRIRYIPKRK